MRVFFALDIDDEARQAITKWRSRNLPSSGRKVPADNLHITLCFLGKISEPQLVIIKTLAGQIECDMFDLQIDQIKHFPKTGLLWLDTSDVPRALIYLVDQLRKIACQAGIASEQRRFRPHITLFRRYHRKPPVSKQQPAFRLKCKTFALFESVSIENGVRYQSLAEWSLG